MPVRNIVFALIWTAIVVLTGGTGLSSAVAATSWMSDGQEVCLERRAANFLILYDRSGSMAEKHNGTIMTKLQGERKILLEKNATLPDMDWQAGIYSFTPAGQLTNLVEYSPMQRYDKKLFSWTLIRMPLAAKGATMLQQGLIALDGILDHLTGRTVVFLFTDGQFSPVAALPSPAEAARAMGRKHDVCFAVINTGTTSEQRATINAIASATPCSYSVGFDELLGNPEWMTNALFTVTAQQPCGAITGRVFENILFDFDQDVVKPQYYQALAESAAYLQDNPRARIVLAGHTDSVGTRTYNMDLSHRRAAAVRHYLVQTLGVARERITLSGFGYSEPVATNTTAAGRAVNRRVQGIITGMR
ncbi:MAG: OmpA family protein [Desulfopila sp.]